MCFKLDFALWTGHMAISEISGENYELKQNASLEESNTHDATIIQRALGKEKAPADWCVCVYSPARMFFSFSN